ncbi:MAG: hypothetical protein II920_10825 [Clostridia bacterium]|nr:hypothetical protein [Clostridia bacterium]
MKNLVRLIIALVCASVLIGSFACAEGNASFTAADEGCWYEVFVYSYSDSDGDGIGDFNGLKSKLDYIEYMGYDGIWLMPIMPSPSYHKYDVTDYMAVDEQYGTMDDFKSLLDDCHARGIRVIIDLPVNHTSTRHVWFTRASSAIKMRNYANKYVNYYTFTDKAANKFSKLQGTDWYYEEQFQGGGMPDLNLDNPEVRAEIEKIVSFWLSDVGVDGFRLDACTSYYKSANENVEFLNWFVSLAKGIKPDCYVVGEVWASLPVIAQYYQSGIDSCFLFPASQAEGYIVSALRSSKPAESYVKNLLATEKAIPDGIIAPFLCNHDTGRTIGLLSARSNPEKAKFAEGVLNMYPGSVFTYYGEEIGMVGSTNDPNKRIAMNWSEDERTSPPPGATTFEYPYPGVYEQLEDEASLLMYCRQINFVKHNFPVIMKGRTETLVTGETYCAIRRFTDNEECVIAINFDSENPVSFAL